jgi:hypothetical protein
MIPIVLASPPVLLQAVDADRCVGTWNRTVIQIWRKVVVPEAVVEMNWTAGRLLAQAGEPVTCLFVVEPSSPPPNDGARKELARFSRDIVPRMALAVIVAEGGGFRAALVRGVGVALTTLAPHSLPFKFVNTVDNAMALLKPHVSIAAGGVDGLRMALGEMRAAMTERGATVSPGPIGPKT